jgi:hypothetical protein
LNVEVRGRKPRRRSGGKSDDEREAGMNYNLLDEKWIPVLYRDGRYERVGIRKALEDAGRIRQIAASNRMERVAELAVANGKE